MAEHWDAATDLLETLVLKTQGQSRNGPDLVLFTGEVQLKHGRDAPAFRHQMQSVSQSNLTNARSALEPLFRNFVDGARRDADKQLIRALTVVVLTDGLWEGMSDPDGITETLVQWDRLLKEAIRFEGCPRPFTIHFVQFGDNARANARLRGLDVDVP